METLPILEHEQSPVPFTEEEIRLIKTEPGCPATAFVEGRLSLDDIPDDDSPAAYAYIAKAYFLHNVLRGEGAGDRMMALQKELCARDVEPLSEQEPLLTVAIPVGIHDEKPETLYHTLDLVAKQGLAGQVEIIVFGNHPAESTDDEEKLDGVLEQFRTEHPDSPVRSVLATHAAGEFSMMRIRKEMTDMIVFDGMQRSFEFDHPVVWLDADMEGMSPQALLKLAYVVRNDERVSPIVTPQAQNFHIEASADPTDAERLAQTFELQGRGLLRRIYKETGKISGYKEESGLTFSLGAYMLTRGLNLHATAHINESGYLIEDMRRTLPVFQKIVNKYNPNAAVNHETAGIAAGAILTSSGRRVIETANAMIKAYKTTGKAEGRLVVGSLYGKQAAYTSAFKAAEAYRDASSVGERTMTQGDWETLLPKVFAPLMQDMHDGVLLSEREIATYERMFPEVPLEWLQQQYEDQQHSSGGQPER